MDWTAAIEKQRTALLRIVLSLFHAMGIEPGGSANTVPWHVRLFVPRVMRTAEAALWWLVFAMAQRDGRASGKRWVDCWTGAAHQPGSLTEGARRGPAFEPEDVRDSENALDAAEISARLNTLWDALHNLPRQARLLSQRHAQRREKPARIEGLATQRNEPSLVRRLLPVVAGATMPRDLHGPAIQAIDSS